MKGRQVSSGLSGCKQVAETRCKACPLTSLYLVHCPKLQN